MAMSRPVAARTRPTAGDDRRRRRLLVAAWLTGMIASTYLALAGTSVGRNVAAPDLWFFQVEVFTRSHLGARPALVLLGLALALLACAWLLLGQAVRLGAGVRWVAGLGASWAVPFAIGFPLFSPDVYHYAAVGSSMQHGVDPFADGPLAAGEIPGIRGAEDFWRDDPSPYAPPFVRLLGLLSRMFDEDVVAVVVALRILVILAVIASAVLVVTVARLRGLDPARSLWLTAANPLFLLHAVSGSHNDALMIVFVLAGAWLALLRRPYLAVALCALGAGVKVMALGVIIVIAVDAALRLPTLGQRLRVTAQIAGTGLGIYGLMITACGYGWDWVRNLSVPGLAVEPLSPPTALALVLRPDDPPLDLVRAAALVIGAAVCALLLTRLPQWGLLRVTAWVFVTIVVSGSVVWPWYLLWPLTFLALTGVRQERWLVVVTSVAGIFLVLPGGQSTLSRLGRPLADALVLATLLAVVAGALWLRSRRHRAPVTAGT